MSVRFNGQQVVQEAQFLRAAAASPLARGTRRMTAVLGDSAACERGGGGGVCADGVRHAAGERHGNGGVRGAGRAAGDVHVCRGAGRDAGVLVSRDADGRDVRAARRGDLHRGGMRRAFRRWRGLRSRRCIPTRQAGRWTAAGLPMRWCRRGWGWMAGGCGSKAGGGLAAHSRADYTHGLHSDRSFRSRWAQQSVARDGRRLPAELRHAMSSRGHQSIFKILK